jgi:hypothetical protein
MISECLFIDFSTELSKIHHYGLRDNVEEIEISIRTGTLPATH